MTTVGNVTSSGPVSLTANVTVGVNVIDPDPTREDERDETEDLFAKYCTTGQGS